MTKIFGFGILGALGCLVGALVGETLLAATRLPPPKNAICLLIDTSGSMGERNGQKLAEVKKAAKEFARARDFTKDSIALVEFESTAKVLVPLSKDLHSIERAIETLTPKGSTRMDLGLQEARREVRSAPGNQSILLFTDGQPDSQDSPITEAAAAKAQNIRIVAIGTDDADTNYLAKLTGDSALVFYATAGRFDEAFKKAQKAIQLFEQSTGTAERYSLPLSIARNGGYSALIAIGLCLALIMGQNHYLHRPLLNLKAAAIGGFGGAICGIIAGALGQLVFQTMTADSQQATGDSSLWDAVSRFVGWTLLGGLLGAAMAYFVPNLKLLRGTFGGAAGGAIGVVGFLVAAATLGGLPARLVGAAVVGLLIGLMVAIVEAVFREAWLEIRYGPNERRNVSLGLQPVSIGTARGCTVYAPNSASIAFRYTLEKGQIICEDLQAGKRQTVLPGDQRAAGSVQVTVQVAGATGRLQTSPAPAHRAAFTLTLPGRKTIPLQMGRKLTTTDLPGVDAAATDGVVAEVVANPKEPTVVGLRNLSRRNWSASMVDGSCCQVEQGRSIRLVSGVKLDFGQLSGEIR